MQNVITNKRGRTIRKKIILTYDDVILKLNEIWDCDIPFGWIPISGDRTIPDTEVFQQFHFDSNISNIADLIAVTYNVTDIYEIREDGKAALTKIEECSFHYDGLEYLYTDKDFRFVIYFSHESSVTVGGKDLIKVIQSVWPNFKNHIWTTPFYD